MARENLVIDVGMHVGEDTAYYLAKGFDVVAVEANPELVPKATSQFASEIANGRLRIIEAAIAETSGTVQLAMSGEATNWSSLSPAFVARNERRGTQYRHVEVPAVRFEEILQEVGVPHYLKIDIEGLDMLCVRALAKFDERPSFLSLETRASALRATFDDVFDELATLWALSYRSFQYVNQAAHPRTKAPQPAREGTYVDYHFTADSSGMFGNDLPNRWKTIEATLLHAQAIRAHHSVGGTGGRWSHLLPGRGYARLRGMIRRPVPWYDLHARLATAD